MPAECPNRSTLFDYLVGKLPEEASDSLSTHVESCPDCQAELATLSDIEDTLLGQLRGAAAPEPYLDESECGRAIAKAKDVAAAGKGDSPLMCEAPGTDHGLVGPFRQMGTVPFSPPEASQTSSLPTQLGEYRLIERLGSGGMGAVYKAVHNRLDRVVALKILPRARTDDQRAIVRFEREMKAIGRLDHPHIVRAYDAREIDDRLVLVMEFVEGLDLGKIVRRLGQLGVGKGDSPHLPERPDQPVVGARCSAQMGTVPFSDACELARQAALGLQAAHEHGMVHRDVKPSNLILTPEGQVKLLDLGLARLQGGKGDSPHLCEAPEGPFRQMGTVPFSPAPLSGERSELSQNAAAKKESGDESPHSKNDEMTGSGQAMGTADYMAPEQTSDSRTVDIRADIYGLGATLYKLLSGRAPFSGPEYQGTFEKMLAHRQTPPPPIRQFCPDIPDALVEVLDRMLAKDPAARYQTPAEAAEALSPFCAGSDLPALLQAAESRSAGVPPALSSAGILPVPGGRDARAPATRRWRTIVAAISALLLVGGLGFGLGIMIHIRNQNGDEATLNVPDGSDIDINSRGKATVTLPGGMTKEKTPQNADLQFEIAKVAGELAAQKAAFKNVDEAGLSPIEVDQLVQSDPVAKQLSTELGWKKMDQRYTEQATKPGAKNPYSKRYADEVDKLQKQYDERVKEIETKIRQDKRSLIQTKIVKLQAMLAALRQQQGELQAAAPASFDTKAIQGTSAEKPKEAASMPDDQFYLGRTRIPPPPTGAAVAFGPVIERVVNARSEGKGNDAIDLAKGKVVDLPGGFDTWPTVTQHNWCAENNVDLFVAADPVPSGIGTGRLVGAPAWQLAPEGLQLGAVLNDRWDNAISKWDLRAALDSNMPGKAATPGGVSIQHAEVYQHRNNEYFDIVGGLPVTFAFKTRYGHLGLLQVLRFIEEPRGVRIRYKLVQSMAAGPVGVTLKPAAPPAVPEVPVCRPVIRDVTDFEDFVGHTEASQTVEVRSRVSGELKTVLFTGGAAVKQGDLLLELDPRQYQAELDKRAADLSVAKIRAQHAAAELERARPLAKSHSISQSDMDRVESERREAQAAVLAAEANLSLAKLNLDSTKICAAISGVIGRPQLSVGNLVTAGTQTLAAIVCADPMYVVFDIDERTVLDLRRRAAEEKAKTGRELPIEVRCAAATEKDFLRRVTIESKDARMDAATGTARWRATLPNPDGVLMPGMFARVRLSVGSPHKALLVPEQTLGSNQGRRFVSVVDKSNTVKRQAVEIGGLEGELRIIKAGLTVDDWVIDSSQPFLAPGTIVKPKPERPSGSRPPPGGAAPDKGAKQEQPTAKPTPFRTATVTRGDIAATVYATGTIEPDEMIDIGASVAGQIISLGLDPRGATDPQFKGKSIDYNSPVEPGTILAKIDPTVYAARVEQEEAGLRRAQAELNLAKAKAKEQTPEVAKASLEAAKATLQQCQSALALARRNLDYTTITSPVKGVILDRRVNVGQNVGSSGTNVSSLFLIAKDLKKMQVWAAVNEADVPRIRKGMEARFTVDAFPKDTFKGTVSQIRMNATMTQNVVVYTVVIGVDNSDLKLMPFLTANVRFEVETRKNVLRVPNAALRWKPGPDLVGSNAATPEAQGATRSPPPGPALWIKTPDGQHVQRIPINVGLSDGLQSEVSGPDVKEGMEIVIGQKADGINPLGPRLFQR